MITFSKDVGELMPGILGIIVGLGGWFLMKHEHKKMRARYFAKHGHYPGERAPKPEPAE